MRSDTGIFRPLGVTQTVTTSGAGAARTGAGVGTFTQHVRISVTGAPVFVAFGGSTIDATSTNGFMMQTGESEVFRIAGGQFVSIIRIGATDATAYIQEMGY